MSEGVEERFQVAPPCSFSDYVQYRISLGQGLDRFHSACNEFQRNSEAGLRTLFMKAMKEDLNFWTFI